MAKRRRNTIIIGVAGMLLAAIIIFLTFWFTYVLVWFVAQGLPVVSREFLGISLRITSTWRYLVTGAFMTLLLIDSIRRADDTEHVLKHRYAPSYAPGGVFFALTQMLTRPQASSTVIVSLLETGPRLAFGCGRMLTEALRQRIDAHACSTVIAKLADSPRAVAWEDLREVFGDANWDSLIAQLRGVPGVVFLQKGLGLSEDLRNELRIACKKE